VERLQPLAHKAQIHVLIDEPEQVILRNLIFQAEIVELRFVAFCRPIIFGSSHGSLLSTPLFADKQKNSGRFRGPQQILWPLAPEVKSSGRSKLENQFPIHHANYRLTRKYPSPCSAATG
jgi:hypothetical protein